MLKKCKSGSGEGLYTCRYRGNLYSVKRRYSKYSDKYDIYYGYAGTGAYIGGADTLKEAEEAIRADGYKIVKAKKISKNKKNILSKIFNL